MNVRAIAPRTARAGSSAGFSMVEMLGVVVILGLIGTVAMVSWQKILPGASANAAMRDLSEVLASTRSEAISRNARFEIHYDLDGERYWVRTPYRVGGGLATAEDDDRRATTHETLLSKAGLEIVQVTIDEETYQDGEIYVRFDPLGTSSAHTVVLNHPSFQRFYTIEVLPLTGEIRFHDGHYVRDEPRDGEFD